MQMKQLAEELRKLLPGCDFELDTESSELIILSKLVWESGELKTLPEPDAIESAVREGNNRMILQLPTPPHLKPRPYNPAEEEDWL